MMAALDSFPLTLREPLEVNRWITVQAGHDFWVQGTWTPKAGPVVHVVTEAAVWTNGNMLKSRDPCARLVGEAVADLFQTTHEDDLKHLYAAETTSELMKRVKVSAGDSAYELDIQQAVHDAVFEDGHTLTDKELAEVLEHFVGVEIIKAEEMEPA